MKSLEGYLLVDNRITGHGVQESAVYTCNHCNAQVVKHGSINPQCHVCGGCQKVICDVCALRKSITLKCVTMDQIADELREKGLAHG